MENCAMTNDLLGFLGRAPSAFHAVSEIARMLAEGGFQCLNEADAWKIEPFGKYYVTRNLSSLIAFIAPEDALAGARVAASHTDSPVFKIKENAELEIQNKYIALNVEKYGGALFSTWLDRPLSVAGRALVRTRDGLCARLVNVNRDMLVIPNVAIHMNRDANDGYKYNAQTDMQPLFGDFQAKGAFQRLVAQAAGADEKDVVSSDLYLYARTPGAVWGARNEFISAPRLDDLECAYLTARAFLACAPRAGMPVLAVFDNEEVGSTTKQGANSTFLTDVIARAGRALGADEGALLRARASSMLLSCDNAHAVHPNHPEFADATNRAYMNEGIVIKECASQAYVTDGASKAILREILTRAGVAHQFFANRSDKPAGGTLGNISASHFSVPSVDIGLAQLAMHSSWETAGAFDAKAMFEGVRAFFDTPISMPKDGAFRIG